MTVIVAQDNDTNSVSLQFQDLRVPCCVGLNGLTHDKKEGDKSTPIGTWPFRRVFYRPDKERRPITRLPLQKITEKMVWSDDPEDEDKYNRLIELPYLYSHEKLWRNDDLYNIIVELGYNDKPPIKGRGSAIFMHLMAKDGSSTAGCISLRKSDLLQLISMIDINEALEIKA